MNIPLTNVRIEVDSQVDGGTSSIINCTGDPADDVVTEANGDRVVIQDVQPTAAGAAPPRSPADLRRPLRLT